MILDNEQREKKWKKNGLFTFRCISMFVLMPLFYSIYPLGWHYMKCAGGQKCRNDYLTVEPYYIPCSAKNHCRKRKEQRDDTATQTHTHIHSLHPFIRKRFNPWRKTNLYHKQKCTQMETWKTESHTHTHTRRPRELKSQRMKPKGRRIIKWKERKKIHPKKPK